jgi:hypothetical protein
MEIRRLKLYCSSKLCFQNFSHRETESKSRTNKNEEDRNKIFYRRYFTIDRTRQFVLAILLGQIPRRILASFTYVLLTLVKCENECMVETKRNEIKGAASFVILIKLMVLMSQQVRAE